MEKICYNCFNESLNGSGVCTRCGYDGAKNREKFPQALPQGSILYGRYIIGRVLGQGGFGITYLAQDYQTKELVAIKEFFPDTMATRTGGTTVTPFSGERGENFAYGRDTFLEEAKTMAEFLDNPNIVRVHSYFEENGTGYFVMEYLDGVSFQQYIKDHGGRISWEEALKVMLPILDALSAMHTKGIIHRDVTPDNIYITKEGAVKLLDFGAARYSLGNVSRSLDVILKHGFAPKEQYKRHGRQGPYTDVYSTAATIYYAITGAKPDDAIERSDEDTLPLPSTLGAKITEAQEKVLLKGLAVQAENRYQTMAAFRDALTGAVQPEPVNKTTPKPVVKDDQKEQKTAGRKNLPKWLIPACAAAVLVFVALQIGMSMGRSSKDSPVVQSPPLTETASQTEALQQTVLETLPTENAAQTETLQETALETIPTPTETQPKPYVMMTTREESLWEIDEEDRENQPFWGQETYLRKDVEAVRFETGLEDAPRNAWDVSQAGDKSILAWMEDGVLHVASEGIIALNPDSSMCFSSFTYLKEIDFGAGVDTSQVTNMYAMFSACRSLTSLDVSSFDTSQVTDMSEMFYNCSNLTSLDVSGFDTSQVTDMAYMFCDCSSLTSLDVSGFDTSQVTRMWFMFCGCSSLTSLDLSGFDTSRMPGLAEFAFTFSGCKSLKNLICSDSRIRSAYEER